MTIGLPLQFVFHHAPGARVLRFVRKIPFLKGLSDNILVDVAGRMTEEKFQVSGRYLALLCALLIAYITQSLHGPAS